MDGVLVDEANVVTAVDALAAIFGIEESFTDARGAIVHTSIETKRALLGAFGANVGNDSAADATLQRITRERGQRPVPPVVVTRERDAVRIPVTLLAGTTHLRWSVHQEDAVAFDGVAAFGDLALLDRTTIDALAYECRELIVPRTLPLGYHTLRIEDVTATVTLIVAPPACILPERLLRNKAWGISAQLYLLRSESNWGIGDYTDLQALVRLTARRGGDVIGLNPLHALFLDDPEHVSPYSPASRLFLNVLNIDVTAVPGFARCAAARALLAAPDAQATLHACRTATHVRYTDIADLKLSLLRLLFADGASGRASEAFERFCASGGTPLRRACIFQALRSHFASAGEPGTSWRCWPKPYQDVDSDDVARFAEERADELAFLAWLQWIADEQLGAAARAATDAGMRIGLYRDLAVGADPDGAEVWANPRAVMPGATVGAPPDIYNPSGQDWGLPPFHPLALQAEAYRSFIELVRANMRHAGAIRIDHVMALQHLYLIPEHQSAAHGAYVRYPMEDLIGILALESGRRNCLVIGEDLGTVPAGFRERMQAANILSYRVLHFETDPNDGSFVRPADYPEAALAVIGSHDLPTTRAWLAELDIDLRLTLQLFDDAQAHEQRTRRERERVALHAALAREALLPASGADAGALPVAMHAYIARSAALLAMVQIDDITGEVAPVNIPTTTTEYPNWSRRQSLTLEQIATDPHFARLAATFTDAGRGNAFAS